MIEAALLSSCNFTFSPFLATIDPPWRVMRLLIMSYLISLSAMATDWHEMAPGKSYKLSQSFALTQRERSSSMIDLSRGERLVLKEVMSLSLPGTSLSLYIFNYPKCSGREMTTDVEMIPVAGSDAEVGTQLEDCEINMYIETKDLYSKSFFK